MKKSKKPAKQTTATQRAAMKIARRHGDETPPRRTFADRHPVAPKPPRTPEPTIAQDRAMDPVYEFAGAFGYYGDDVYWLGFPYLAELTQRPEYRMISEIRAKEMTRKGFELTYAGEDEEKAESRLAELDQACGDFRVIDLLRVAAEHDGFYGGGHIYIEACDPGDDAELKAPLMIDKAKIGQGALKGFKNIEPIWCYPAEYNSSDPLMPHYFRPQHWYVNDKTVHVTRLLTMISREMPDILKPSYSFRGLSLSQAMKPYIDNWLRDNQSVSDLLHSFSVIWLKSNLAAQVSNGAPWASIYQRMDEFNALRDNRGAFVLDMDTEELGNLAVPLGTLDALRAQSAEYMAAFSQTPLVKFFGTTPAGLNSSTDGEIRVFYDTIHALQEHLFDAPLGTMLDCIQLHLWGEIDENIDFKYVPLWQLDEQAETATRKTEAEIDAVYVQEGILSQEEVRKKIASDKSGPYAGIDADDLPEPPDDNGEAGMSSEAGGAKGESTEQQRSGV